MALRTVSNSGGNWNATGTWVGGVVPIAGDTVDFTATSGNLIVNVSTASLAGIDFTNYVGTITFNNPINLNTSLNFGTGGYTQAGANGISINGNTTITGTPTWSRTLTTTSGTFSLTLLSDLNLSGLLSITTNLTINGAYSINCSGGLTNIGGVFLQGTGSPTLNLTGGVVNSTAFITLNTNINGTLSITNLYFSKGTLTYLSGTITGNKSLNTQSAIYGTPTLNTSGMTWGTHSWSGSITLTSDLNLGGLLTTTGSTAIVNGTYNINCSGGLTINNVPFQKGTGSPILNLLGGTWSHNTAQALQLDLNINGNITISGNVYYNTGTLTYISGETNTSGSTLLIQAPTTFNTNIMLWNNISYSSTASTTLLSDLNIGGLYTTFGTFNGNFNINCYGGIRPTGSLAQGTGTTTLNLIGGTWSSAANYIQINTNINGNITISGTVYFMTATLTYLGGKLNVLSGSILSITTCTLINIDKINWRTIQINASATITMNKFFSGSALIPTRIQSSTTTNYNITFQDGFEKITKFTKISNCTVTNRGQLLCITDKSNKGGNVGIRYINQSPNGVAKNAPSVKVPLAYSVPSYLEADPNFIIN